MLGKRCAGVENSVTRSIGRGRIVFRYEGKQFIEIITGPPVPDDSHI